MGMIRKLHIVLSGIIIIVIVLLGGIFFIPKFLGYMPYDVLTGSMKPSYPVGSLIYVKQVSADTLKTGDIITINNAGTPITHRIVSIDKEQQLVYTKGDANQDADGAVSFNQIIGKAAKVHFPFLGTVFQVLQNGSNRKIIIIGMAIFLLFWLVTDIEKNKK